MQFFHLKSILQLLVFERLSIHRNLWRSKYRWNNDVLFLHLLDEEDSRDESFSLLVDAQHVLEPFEFCSLIHQILLHVVSLENGVLYKVTHHELCLLVAVDPEPSRRLNERSKVALQ